MEKIIEKFTSSREEVERKYVEQLKSSGIILLEQERKLLRKRLDSLVASRKDREQQAFIDNSDLSELSKIEEALDCEAEEARLRHNEAGGRVLEFVETLFTQRKSEIESLRIQALSELEAAANKVPFWRRKGWKADGLKRLESALAPRVDFFVILKG